MRRGFNQGVLAIWRRLPLALFAVMLLTLRSYGEGLVTVPEAGERWTSAYLLMEEGNRLWYADDYRAASEKFAAAAVRFGLLQREHPGWRPELVSFRLEYCRLKQSECEAELREQRQGLAAEKELAVLREQLQVERERTAGLEQRLAEQEAKQGRQVASLRQEAAAAQGQVETLTAELKQLRQRLAEASLARVRLEREAAKRVAGADEVRQLREALSTALAEHLELEAAAKEMREEVTRLRSEKAAWTERSTAVQGEHELAFRKQPLLCPAGVSRATGVRFWGSAAAAPEAGVDEALLASYWEWRDGKQEAALTWLETSFSRGSALLPLWLGLARWCLTRGELERALALAATAAACAPENVSALTTLGAVHLQQGDLGSAERLLRRAVSLSASAYEAQLCLSALLAQRGEKFRAEGRRWYEAALAGGGKRDAVLDAYYGVQP